MFTNFSWIRFGTGIIAALLVAYIGLIALVMSYASVTIEFSQSIREDSSRVAQLETQYLSSIAHLTSLDYTAHGYVVPKVTSYVLGTGVTAIR